MTRQHTVPDPLAAARSAHLHYVSDDAPGVRRLASGKGFRYLDANGKAVDKATRERIVALVIPPAWKDVWICSDPNGHIQATGRDVRGRKQYRYHDRWREVRDATKYDKLVAFASVLPKIREAVARDMSASGLSRDKVVATVVRLLETTYIRIGNEDYARDNGSYGLTTLRNRHIDVTGATLRFEFRGKSKKSHVVEVQDRRVARIVRALTDLPGQALFQYLDDEGARHGIESSDVNAYLQAIAGDAFTAKDFRTWAGTVLATTSLSGLDHTTKTAAKQSLVQAIKAVASRLGNTPAVCRRCYVHPAIIDAFEQGALDREVADESAPTAGLSPAEKRVLKILAA